MSGDGMIISTIVNGLIVNSYDIYKSEFNFPDGWEFNSFGVPKKGDYYIHRTSDSKNGALLAQALEDIPGPTTLDFRFIVKKKENYARKKGLKKNE